MRDVYVAGVGMIPFGKFPEARLADMGARAALAAIKDSDIPPERIAVAWCGHTRAGTVAGQRILAELGLTGIEIVNCDNACASGATAFRGVWHALAAGFYDCGLVLGVEHMTQNVKGVIPPREDDLEGALGRVMPSHYAFLAQGHMARYGTTREQMAKVSVKSHRNGALNPYAQYRKPVTIEEVLASRVISDPLTLLECCPTGDGAAAAVLTATAPGRALKVKVRASVLLSGKARQPDYDNTSSPLTVHASRLAYEQAGIGPGDVDVCECHDAFSIAELVHYENLGFCRPGEGGRFIAEGRSEIGGLVAVNPSGGLLSKGHPLGATGVAQIAEIVWQLRGEAGQRQHPDARIGLAHVMGGAVTGIDSGACAIHILEACQ